MKTKAAEEQPETGQAQQPLLGALQRDPRCSAPFPAEHRRKDLSSNNCSLRTDLRRQARTRSARAGYSSISLPCYGICGRCLHSPRPWRPRAYDPRLQDDVVDPSLVDTSSSTSSAEAVQGGTVDSRGKLLYQARAIQHCLPFLRYCAVEPSELILHVRCPIRNIQGFRRRVGLSIATVEGKRW